MARRSRRPKCVKTYLTGQDGRVQFQPPGTDICINDYCPFTGDGSSGNTKITLTCDADFRVEDCVEFIAEGDANLDGSYQHRISYFVVDAGTWDEDTYDACGNNISGLPWIEVSLDPDGSVIPPSGNGGTLVNGQLQNSEDGLIRVKLCDYMNACDVRSFNLQVTREQFSVIQIACEPDPCSGKRSKNKKVQVGDTEISGSATVILDNYHDSLNQRLVASSVDAKDPTAIVRFFVHQETDASGESILEESFYVEGEIIITGISMTVAPDEIIEVTIDFIFNDTSHFLSKPIGPKPPAVDTSYFSACIVCTAGSTWDGSTGEITNSNGNEICDGIDPIGTYAPTTAPGPNFVATGAGVIGEELCE